MITSLHDFLQEQKVLLLFLVLGLGYLIGSIKAFGISLGAVGGVLLAGISNPIIYIFDYEAMEDNNTLEVKYPLPYSDLESLSPDALGQRIETGEPLEYSHSLDAQIGGQLQAGFVLTGFYEDEWGEDDIINDYFPTFMATRAVKPPLK